MSRQVKDGFPMGGWVTNFGLVKPLGRGVKSREGEVVGGGVQRGVQALPEECWRDPNDPRQLDPHDPGLSGGGRFLSVEEWLKIEFLVVE